MCKGVGHLERVKISPKSVQNCQFQPHECPFRTIPGPESLSYQKKDERAWQHPSLFWYGTDFSKMKKKLEKKS